VIATGCPTDKPVELDVVIVTVLPLSVAVDIVPTDAEPVPPIGIGGIAGFVPLAPVVLLVVV
jgi:hypothetical protein